MAGPSRPTAGQTVTPVAPASSSSRRLLAGSQREERSLAFSVVICSYTEARWALFVRSVQSAFAQTLAPSQVVVVIDHCPSLLRRARQELTELAALGDTSLTIVANTGQPGLADARNTGLRVAHAELVAFLDDDAAADPDWLMQLSEAYCDPEVVAAGGRVVADWETGRPAWFPTEFDWVVGCSYRGLPEAQAPVRNLIGANMSFRREALLAGGFRTSLGRLGTRPSGCEETELCIRLASRRQGQRILYEPAAMVRHHVPASRATWAYFRSRCYAEGLSKATVQSLAGSSSALSSERSYMLTTIPRGIGQALRRGLDREPAGARAIAIVLGVVATVAGYARGRIRREPRESAPAGETAVSRAIGGIGLAALPSALLLWWLALQHIDLRRMTDIGLVSVLPGTFWAALGTLAVGFAITITRRRPSTALLAAYVIALIVVLHGTPVLLYGTLRYTWAWKHVGLIDDILRNGRLSPGLSGELVAYRGWPGFFGANALLVRLAGWRSALSYASWAPPFFNLLFLGPLLMIFRRYTTDRRLVWTAVWFFYLGNWVGQDYLSPQALCFFLYLVVIAVCLRWYSSSGVAVPANSTTTTVRALRHRPRARAAVLFLVVVLVAAIACSHQLTPFMLISAVTTLVVFRRCSERLLPFVSAALIVGWIAFAARTFLQSNLHGIVTSIGHPGANTQANFIDLSHASAGQAVVANFDRILSASLWVLAAIGVWRRRSGLRADLPLLLLALSPLVLLFANSYDGEMVFRVYLFALPFVAFFAAATLFPSRRASWSRRWAVGLAVLSLALLAAFTFSYYGNEQVNYFSPQEVQAGSWLNAHAPRGSYVVGPTGDLPWGDQNVEWYHTYWFALDVPSGRAAVLANPVRTLSNDLTDPRYPASYLVFTRAQTAMVNAIGMMPAGSVTAIQRAVISSGRFRVVFHNANATILVPARPGARL